MKTIKAINMKSRWFATALILLGAAMFASCEKDPVKKPTPPPIYDPLKISISASGYTGWQSNDAIALFWKRTDEPSNLTKYSISAESINNNTGNANFTGTLDWDASKLQQYLYASYPYLSVESGVTPEKYPVNLPAEQIQNGTTLANYSILVAKPVTVVAPDFGDEQTNKPVEMEFANIFSTLELRLVAFDKSAVVKSIKVGMSKPGEVKDFAITNGHMNITAPAFGSDFCRVNEGTPADYVKLSFSGSGANVPATTDPFFASDPFKPAGTDVLVARMTILPGNYANAGNFVFTIVTDKGEYIVESQSSFINRGENNVINIMLPVTTFNYDIPWDGTIADAPQTLDISNKQIEIVNGSQLAWLAAVVNQTKTVAGLDSKLSGYKVKLRNNINLNNKEWTPIGISSGKHFEGAFEGNGYSVNNLKISLRSVANVGLFGHVRTTASIKNLTVKGEVNIAANITAASQIGGIIGAIQGSSATARVIVENCHFDGKLKATSSTTGVVNVSGISGTGIHATFNLCSFNGSLDVESAGTGIIYASGISAITSTLYSISINNCANYADITGKGYIISGGISSTGNANGCKNAGNITLDARGNTSYAGGIIALTATTGVSFGNVTSSYNTGDITVNNMTANVASKSAVGGIVGYMASTGALTITGCYSTGTISTSGTEATIVKRKGNIVGDASLSSVIQNNFFKPTALDGDKVSNLSGKVTQFSATAWPTKTLFGWGTGNGNASNTYWKDPLPAYGAEYPSLNWE